MEQKIIVRSGIPSETVDFIKDLYRALYTHLPHNFKEKLESRVRKIVLGSSLPYSPNADGAYSYPEVDICRGVLYVRDPHEIAEVFFHEIGHALLNDEFPRIDPQTSADFLSYYALENSSLFHRSKSKYEIAKPELTKLLGDNTEFVKNNRKAIQEKKKEWYPKLEEEAKFISGIVLPQGLKLAGDTEKYLKELFPPIDNLLQKYEEEDNPLRKLDIYETVTTMERILRTPVREFSDRTTSCYIPWKFVENIEKRSGIFIGVNCLLTPKNDINYSIIEILERGLKFKAMCSFFTK